MWEQCGSSNGVWDGDGIREDKLRRGSGGAQSEAEPPPAEAGSARPSIRKEACGFADLGRSSVWRPMVVDRMRGSKWPSALPTGSRLWGSSLESFDHEESGGSNLWPTDSLGRRQHRLQAQPAWLKLCYSPERLGIARTCVL